VNIDMKLSVKVDTYVNGNLIVQDVSSAVDDKTSQLSRKIYDTSEKGFRDALVKMGWMPPGVLSVVLSDLRNIEESTFDVMTAALARAIISRLEGYQ
jgi:hypothetical protein